MPKKKSRNKRVVRKKSKSRKRVIRKKSKSRKKVVRKNSKSRKKVVRKNSKSKKKFKQDNVADQTEFIIKTKPEWVKASLMSKANYQKKYKESIKNNDGFWKKEGKRITWIKSYKKVKDVKYSAKDVKINGSTMVL